MYFPKNRIKTGLYSQGELLRKDTKETYFGYYWSTFEGQYFSGKDQNSLNSIELIKPSEQQEIVAVQIKQNLKNELYNNISGLEGTSKKLPIPYIPNPKEQDYEKGFINRYFVKRITGKEYKIYIEINQEQFGNFQSNTLEFATHLYYPFSVKWYITGNKEEVMKKNKEVIQETIRKDKGIEENFYFYFRDFTQFLK